VHVAAERLRKLKHEAERQRVFQHQWSEGRYQDYRTIFFLHTENMGDSLTWKQTSQAVAEMWSSWSPEDVVSALSDLSVEPGMNVDFLTFLDLMRIIEGHEALCEVALEEGMDRESADLLCKEWRRLKPSKEGTVPWRRIKRLVGGSGQPDSEVSFADFVGMVQGTCGASSPVRKASRLKALLH